MKLVLLAGAATEAIRGPWMKWDRLEVFLRMGDEDATLLHEGGSNDTECIIELQGYQSHCPSNIGFGSKIDNEG